MTQPTFVPISPVDQVRPSVPLPAPSTKLKRPAEVVRSRDSRGVGLGSPGPDQGYALTLSRRLVKRLVLSSGENVHDVEVGLALLASRRASLLGRAPVIFDVELAAALFGFLDQSSEELIEERRRRFRSISHRYSAQRSFVDRVPERSLLLGVDEVRSGGRDWHILIGR